MIRHQQNLQQKNNKTLDHDNGLYYERIKISNIVDSSLRQNEADRRRERKIYEEAVAEFKELEEAVKKGEEDLFQEILETRGMKSKEQKQKEKQKQKEEERERERKRERREEGESDSEREKEKENQRKYQMKK